MNFDSTLSSQLDEALANEEHYRALLLFWKQRRQKLERQIHTILDEASQIAENAFNDTTDAITD